MILLTGVTSGLGKFLAEALPDAKTWRRGEPTPPGHFDTIIHCAHDLKNPQANEDMLDRLFAVPCGRFVYVSSVDVHKAYALDNGGYGLAKLRCEETVRARYGDHLIVRPCVLLGPTMRENTLLKMLRGKKLSVTPKSTFAFVRHESLLPVLTGPEQGTVTVSGGAMAIEDYAEALGLSPEYGPFTYETPPVKPTHDSLAEVRGFMNTTEGEGTWKSHSGT